MTEKVSIVHFKRLGSRRFYNLFERCYFFFFLNHNAYCKTTKKNLMKLRSQWENYYDYAIFMQ